MADPQNQEQDFEHILPPFDPGAAPEFSQVAPIITGRPAPNPFMENLGLAAFPASLGEVLKATAGEAAATNPVGLISRFADRTFEDFAALAGAPGTELLSAAEATRRHGFEYQGKQGIVFDRTISDASARELAEQKKKELIRQSVLARAQGGFVEGSLQLLTGLAVSAVDPINIASAFIPVVGEARYLNMLRAASGPLGRAGVRLGVGAAEGFVGAAAVEPLVYLLAQSEYQDYTANDSLHNLMFGTVLGGGLHAGFGAVGDRLGISALARSNQADAVRAVELARLEADKVKADALKGAGLADDVDVLKHAQNLNMANPFPSSLELAWRQLGPEERHAVWQVALADAAEHGRLVHTAEFMRLLDERRQLGEAYDNVRARPQGPIDDPLVRIQPADMERILVERGPASVKDGEVTIAGRGYGLVKFIFKHGEGSAKAPGRAIARDDVLAFPQVVRDYAPFEHGAPGREGYRREWIVERNGRQIIYATTRFDGEHHTVTMHVLDKPRELSRRLEGESAGGAGSPDGIVPPERDTAGGLRTQLGQSQSSPAGMNIGPAPAPHKMALDADAARQFAQGWEAREEFYSFDVEDRAFLTAQKELLAGETSSPAAVAGRPTNPSSRGGVSPGPKTTEAQAELTRVLEQLGPDAERPEIKKALEGTKEQIERARADAEAFMEAARCANRGA